MHEIKGKYYQVINMCSISSALFQQLNKSSINKFEISPLFHKSLEFGTGGLRGIMGVGANCMNTNMVARATQGYADYLNEKRHSSVAAVAVAYDSRINSDIFAITAAEVLAANGIHVHICRELMPTPLLSFTVRKLGCIGGIVITASHNPANYNGYKIYEADGCQITNQTAKAISKLIKSVDTLEDIRRINFQEAVSSGLITYIEDKVSTEYINTVSAQSLCANKMEKDISIVYSPLNGTGLQCVLRVLKENGYTNISVVKEQEQPDGQFSTCPYPNPEEKEALKLAIRDARELKSDLVLATDPDCDRVGVAVKDGNDYKLLSGNEVGMLLLDYICKRRLEIGCMPEKPIIIKTIVSSDMAKKIAEYYNVEVIEVLTGFKYIGEQISILEERKEEKRFIMGFEESCGYLTGSYVRDKDAVNASLMICEMAAFYRKQGLGLNEKMNNLYERYGYCLNTLHSYTFDGKEGFVTMQKIMKNFRINGVKKIGDKQTLKIIDYLQHTGLPKSDVLKYIFEDNLAIVIRPSGTEPKLKLYISVSASDKEKAVLLEKIITGEMEELIKRYSLQKEIG